MNEFLKEMWWERITGPHRVLSEMVEALVQCNHALLIASPYIAWRERLCAVVEEKYRQCVGSADCMFYFHDANEFDAANIGASLVRKYGLDAQPYRAGGKETIQSYIIKNSILKNRVVWISAIAPGGLRNWIQFIQNYSVRNLDNGLFVLEVTEDNGNDIKHKNITSVFCSTSISSSDVRTYSEMVLGLEGTLEPQWCGYIAQCAANLCDCDADSALSLVSLPEMRKRDISGALRTFSDVALKLYSAEALQKALWKAQIQVAFPLIELMRVDFINKWRIEIERALLKQAAEQFGEIIYDPSDLELGTLYYMNKNKLSDNLYWLYIPAEEDRDWLSFLRNTRNTLAHGNVCSDEELIWLLDQT